MSSRRRQPAVEDVTQDQPRRGCTRELYDPFRVDMHGVALFHGLRPWLLMLFPFRERGIFLSLLYRP